MNDIIDPVNSRCHTLDVFLWDVYRPLMQRRDGIRSFSMRVWQACRLAIRQCAPGKFKQPRAAVRDGMEELTGLPDRLVRQRIDEVTLDEPTRHNMVGVGL
jgi:hypothetical protein